MALIYILIVLVTVLTIGFVFGRKNDKVTQFKNRPNLSLEDIYDQFFAESQLPQEIVAEVWQELANTLELPAGLLRPEDRFDRELAPQEGNEWDDPIGVLPATIKRHYKEVGMPLPPLTQIQTVRDYIYFVAKTMTATKRKDESFV